MHDWHPYLVHFPIALLISGFIFHLIQIWRPYIICRIIGLWILGLSCLFSFATVLTGQRAATQAGEVGYASDVLELIQKHEILGNIIVWGSLTVFLGWLTLFMRNTEDRRVDTLALAFLGLLAVMVVLTGYTGGQLVFTHGVGTP